MAVHAAYQRPHHAFHFQLEEHGAQAVHGDVGLYGQDVDVRVAFAYKDAHHCFLLFAQFGDSVERLTRLLSVHLEHPVNAMTAVCKRLALPKKAALEAIDMYEMAVGNDEASAHEVFVAMQEIPFILKTKGMPESKLLALQENMARALTINWRDYDYAKEVKW